MSNESDYHEARVFAETAMAEMAENPLAASSRLELARLHDARRETTEFVERLASGRIRRPILKIFRTDKEA